MDESLEMRVQTVLNEIRPLLQFHKGDAEFESIKDGVVRLKLTGSCHGCPMSVITFGMSLRSLLSEKVPEVKNVVWDGIEHEDNDNQI